MIHQRSTYKPGVAVPAPSTMLRIIPGMYEIVSAVNHSAWHSTAKHRTVPHRTTGHHKARHGTGRAGHRMTPHGAAPLSYE